METSQPPIQEKKDVLPERILANHCRFMATMLGRNNESYMLNVIKRSYKLGAVFNLKFENFPEEFQTKKLEEALRWLENNPPKRKTK